MIQSGTSDNIDIYVDIRDYSSPENVTVKFYYMFQQDISGEARPPMEVTLNYNPTNGMWEGSIPRKYDASTLHYYLNITDGGTHESVMTEDSEYSYTTPLDFQYGFCIVGAVVVFAAFEVMMHYGKFRERFPRKEEEGEKEKKEEEGSGE